MRAMPDDMTVLLEWGRVAEAREDWAEAYRRWDSLRTRHPAGFDGAAHALYKLGRTAEAEALLAEGRLLHPIHPGIAIMYARIAHEAGDKVEALKRWAVVRQRFPLDRAGYEAAIRLLREQQEWAEAETIAQAAIERFPAYPWPLAEYAMLAHARKDWVEAARRWAALRAAFPDHKEAQQREAEALAAAGLHATDEAAPGSSQPPGTG